MRTLDLKTRNKVEVRDYQVRYSGAFRKMFANSEMLADKGFEAEIRKQFGMDSWMYQSLKIDVLTKQNQIKTNNKNKERQLKSLKKELEELVADPQKGTPKQAAKIRRRKYKINKRIASIECSIDRGITFGGRVRLQIISYLHNKFNDSRKQKQRENIGKEIEKVTDEYHEKRLLSYTVIGEAPQKSNRKFDFDFLNNKLIFKPSMGVKIPVEFYCSKGQKKILEKLQGYVGEIPITVRLSEDYVQIIYDEEKLSGFAFDQNAYDREKKHIPKENKQEFKDCKKKFFKQQEERMLVGKIKDRGIAFDLNPEFIGVAIFDKVGSEIKIIYKKVISLKGLNTKLGLSSTDAKQIKQNFKRIHELREIWKEIFKTACHYKVSKCYLEDLEFKEKGVNEAPKQANRIVKSFWHKEKTLDLIDKYCRIFGISKNLVNACYTTFIGNIKHCYFDPLNAALEVGRRGAMQFEGGFYPSLERSDFDTMSRIFGLDVQGKTISTWVDAHKSFKTAKLRYRRDLPQCKFVETNLNSFKSSVKILHF